MADDISILNRAEKQKQDILNSQTIVTVSGTKYYISNSGDDNNDGLSADNPWATLEKLRWAQDNHILKEGDGVFFKRGEVLIVRRLKELLIRLMEKVKSLESMFPPKTALKRNIHSFNLVRSVKIDLCLVEIYMHRIITVILRIFHQQTLT